GLPPQVLESELFGEERGLVELADHGTLFLDETGGLDSGVQLKILEVLAERRFRSLGSVRDRAVDVRLIAATQRDLAAAVAAGRFHPDLWFRINKLVLRVPALRERPEDIPALARSILERQGGGRELSPGALAALEAYPWPGN